MTVRYYLSTDPSAPTLAYNVAGSMIGVLDACLVNGYGSRTAAGWTKPYSGTNLAVYRQGAGPMRYLDVSDTGTGSSSFATVRGYESMSGTGTGTDPFPTVVQAATPQWYKGYTTNTTAWVVVADEKAFYLYILTSGGFTSLVFFGEPNTIDPADAFATQLIFAATTINNSTQGAAALMKTDGSFTVSPGHWSCRTYDQSIKSYAFTKHTDIWKNNAVSYLGGTNLSNPNTTDGGIYYAPVWCTELNSSSYIRSIMPGLWCPLTATSTLNHLDVITPTSGDMFGKTLLFLRPAAGSNGSMYLEISNTWR